MKNKRLKLGIIYNFNPVWMGGIIYILNLIKTLNFLEDKHKPEIILFYRPDLNEYVEKINYPYLQKIEWKFPSVYSGFINSWLKGKNLFINDIINHHNLDGVYPVHDYPVKTKSKTKLVSWFADLQHEYYPEFFTKRKRIERTMRIKFMLRNSKDLVVSSNAVANDFKKFFNIHNHINIHVYHFVSVIEDLDKTDINKLKNKYHLPDEYFMISNQFHKHKNHKVLLKALLRLKKKGTTVHFAMTGRFPDASYSEYMQELHKIINENKLQTHISFLGVIPRNEQLLLMRNSQAVIQPSLFEGWSTVIEDAISLQVPVIASSLPVNIEQLGPYGNYFDPHDDEKLAEILSKYPKRNLNDMFYQDYKERIKTAAQQFIKIFNN